METINNWTFVHGYTISKLSLTSILIYRSKWGYVVATISLIKPFRQWYLLFNVWTLIWPCHWPLVTFFGCLLESSMYGDHTPKRFISVHMFVPNRYKTCRKTSMDKYNGGRLGCCLGYHGNHQDAKCQPSLKINFRDPPTQSNQEKALYKKCRQITPGTRL